MVKPHSTADEIHSVYYLLMKIFTNFDTLLSLSLNWENGHLIPPKFIFSSLSYFKVQNFYFVSIIDL